MFVFSPEEQEKEMHDIYLEDDDLQFICEQIEGEGKDFVATGIAVVEGERYRDFQIAFHLAGEAPLSAVELLAAEWEWYDFLL